MTIPSCLKDLVLELPRFLDAEFCARMIHHAESMGFDPATITTEDGSSVVPDIRNNGRVILDDAGLANDLWTRLRRTFAKPFKGQTAIGLNERLRLYRYSPGQFFDWHQDGEYRRSPTVVSRFTMLVYLNDAFEGGGTTFSDVFSPQVFPDFTIRPETGKALLFHHPLSHEGDPVQHGQKHVLRTDVMFESEA